MNRKKCGICIIVLVSIPILALCACGMQAEQVYTTEASTLSETSYETEPETQPVQGHVEGSGVFLTRNVVIPDTFGFAQYTVEEIIAMKDYSAEELQAAIATIPDFIQYIILTDYGDEPAFIGDIVFNYRGYWWSVNKSPEGALLSQSNSCGAISNLARYILEDDYDEEGFIGWSDRFTDSGQGGGHVYNYFKKGDEILAIDFGGAIYFPNPEIPEGKPYIITGEVVPRFEDLVPYILSKTEMQPTRVFFQIFVERDVHRDHAPRASMITSRRRVVAFFDSSYQDEIEILYFDEEWLKNEGAKWYEYHYIFENIGVTEEMIPSELVDSADMTEMRIQ